MQQNISLSAPIMSRFDLFFVLVDDCNEVTDYAIARRIVDLHSRKHEAVKRMYSMVSLNVMYAVFTYFADSNFQEDIRRYLLFARQFKPKICKASADYMVEEYKRLRQRDSSGGCQQYYGGRISSGYVRLPSLLERLLLQALPGRVIVSFLVVI